MFGARLVRAFERGEGPLRSQRAAQSRQDRARAEVRRPQRCSATARTIAPKTMRDAARLVGLSRRRRRFPGRGRDVQQQRRLPRARGRRDVPELSRHPRRARRHARARQHAAARHHRPARAGCADVRRDGGDDEALRLLQGLPARMPDRRRHGAHEDRGAGGARRQAWPHAARPADRLSAALCAVRRRIARLANELANLRNDIPRLRGWSRAVCRLEREAQPAAVAPRVAASRRAASARRMRRDGRAASPTRSTATSSRRTSRPRSTCSTAAGCASMLPRAADGQPAAVLRPHVSVGRAGRRGAQEARALRRGARAVRRARHSGRRARAELHPRLPRRDPGAGQERGRAAAGVAHRSCSRSFWRARRRRARSSSPLKPVAKRALLHGHCHQKSFGAMSAVEAALKLVPELAVETVESSCCGMAGAFGYGADTIDVSLKMAELSLLPAVRKAEPDTLDRRRRHLVPASDRGRHRPRGAPRRPRPGDEP